MLRAATFKSTSQQSTSQNCDSQSSTLPHIVTNCTGSPYRYLLVTTQLQNHGQATYVCLGAGFWHSAYTYKFYLDMFLFFFLITSLAVSHLMHSVPLWVTWQPPTPHHVGVYIIYLYIYIYIYISPCQYCETL